MHSLPDLRVTLGSLTLGLVRDDGAVVYFNGSEVARDMMPAGTIHYQTLSDGIVGGAGLGDGVVEAAALVDDRPLVEFRHGHCLEVGRVVVHPTPVDVLAAVEVDHVEAAGVEDVGQTIGDLVEEVRLLVDDVAVDAAVDRVVPALRFHAVRRRLRAPRSARAAKERIPLALRSDGFKTNDLVVDYHFLMLVNLSMLMNYLN